MTLPASNWNYPTAVRFGNGRVRDLAELCDELGIRRPLVVTDRGLAALEPMDRVRDALAIFRPAVFSEVDANPVGANVDAGVELLRSGDHDGVVCVGGGSALDVGKAIALMAGQTRPMWDFEDVGDNWKRVDPDGVVPTIAVPTTAGTGSEVGRSSVITHVEAARKVIVFHPSVMPEVALLDPELTVGLPAPITAATGIDALSHCLEAYCASGHHPMADGIAVEGIRLVKENLERAVAEPSDLDARGAMLVASTMGATAFQKGLGAMHALSHPLSVHLGQHHGRINAVVMPYVLAYNFPAIETRLGRLAAFLGLEPSASALLEWILALREATGIPHTLRDLTMREKHVERFAADAAVDPAGFANPRALDAPGYAELYRHCLSGSIPATR